MRNDTLQELAYFADIATIIPVVREGVYGFLARGGNTAYVERLLSIPGVQVNVTNEVKLVH